MDDAESCEKETRAQRKQKPIILKRENDLSSDDSYSPPKDVNSDDSYSPPKDVSSDDSYSPPKNVIDDCSGNSYHDKRKTKKLKTKQLSQSKTIHKNKKKSKCRGRRPLGGSNVQRKRKRSNKRRVKEDPIIEGGETKVPVLKKNVRQLPFLGPNSIIGHWYIASGFTKDLTALFKAFDKLESWRFSAFATCWQNMKFSLIYRGRYSFKELLEFTEEVCLWTKKFTSPIHNTKWRVGALYALYGLYHKHPMKHYFKIRLEAVEYERLEYLARSFQNSAENPDPAYVFYKLKADGAFYYVASSDEMGLNFYSPEREQDIMNYEAQWVLQEHSASTIFPEQERNIQKMLMEEYEKVKSQLWGDGSEPNKALSYVQPGILSQVDAILAGLQEDSQEKTPQAHEEWDIGQKRGAIRDRAATLSTTDDFLKRKQLRSPQKRIKVEHHALERSTDSSSCNEAVQEDNLNLSDECNKVEKLKEIMGFMQPSSKRIPGNPLRSVRINRKKTLQENFEENPEDAIGSYTEIEDLQGIFMQGESSKRDNYDSLSSKSSMGTKKKHLPEHEKEISSPEQNGNPGNPGSFNGLKEGVGCEETPEKRNRKSLPPKNIKRMPQKSQLRSFRHKRTEQPQVEESEIPHEENKIPCEENKSQSRLVEGILDSSVSENKTEESNPVREVALSESSPRSTNRRLPQGEIRGKPRKNLLRKKVTRHKANKQESEADEIPEEDGITKGALVKKCSDPFRKRELTGEIQISEENEMEDHQMLNETSEKSEDDSRHCSTATEILSHPRRQTGAELNKSFASPSNVTKEIESSQGAGEKNIVASDEDGQANAPEMVCEEMSANEENTNNESAWKVSNNTIHCSERVCKKVDDQAKSVILFSDQRDQYPISQTGSNKETVSKPSFQENRDIVTNNSSFIDQPNHESIQHTVGNNQTMSNSVSQQNSDNTTFVENTINVKISASVPKKEHHKSKLTAKSIFILNVKFFVKSNLIHSMKFKIIKKDLEAIKSDETTLEKFKNKFCAFLPPKYKNYKMLLQLTDCVTDFDKGGSSLSVDSKQNSQSALLKKCSKEDFQTTPEEPPTQNYTGLVANSTTTVQAEESLSFQVETSSSKVQSLKESENTLMANSFIPQESCKPNTTNSLPPILEQAKSTEAGSKDLPNYNKDGAQKYDKNVSRQDNATIEATTNQGNIVSVAKVNLNTVEDKSLSSHSPPATLSGNLLQSSRPDASESDSNRNSVCSFYFFSRRNRRGLPTEKLTKSSSGQV